MRSTISGVSPTASGSASGPREVAASRSSGRLIRRSGSPIRGRRGIVGTGGGESYLPRGAPGAGTSLQRTMIGPLEIAIIAVVLLVIFGYRYLPGLGRRAGEGAREVKESVQEMVGDKADPKTLGRRAGEGLREAREFRDALTGKVRVAAARGPLRPRPPRPADRRPSPTTTSQPSGPRRKIS